MDATLKIGLIIVAVLTVCTIISVVVMVVSTKMFGKKCDEFHEQLVNYALLKLQESEQKDNERED